MTRACRAARPEAGPARRVRGRARRRGPAPRRPVTSSGRRTRPEEHATVTAVDANLDHAGIRVRHEALPVGRPGRRAVPAPVGHLAETRAVGVGDPDVSVRVRRRGVVVRGLGVAASHEGDPRAVGRPLRKEIGSVRHAADVIAVGVHRVNALLGPARGPSRRRRGDSPTTSPPSPRSPCRAGRAARPCNRTR